MSEHNANLATLLQDAKNAMPGAGSRLLEAVYGELKALAAYHLVNENPDNSLQATALVHEAYVRLVGSKERTWNDRAHFFAAAAQAMRHILVDHARQRHAQKRGGNVPRVQLTTMSGIPALDIQPDVESLDGLLIRLENDDSLAARIVEMRFFCNMTEEEIALALGISSRSVRRHWRYARAWLAQQLGTSRSDPP